ncbi:MAG: hypothetical protein U5R46_12430 [Gammaproteobacteria bacterium]|nr:hypothetical protein [Gammaproteobacteria bacterium]
MNRRAPGPLLSWLLIGLCVALAAASMYLHPDAAPGIPPLKYPLLGAAVAAVLVLVVRVLRPVLHGPAGDDHAD